MKKYIVEFIGTFFLVLVIALTGNPIAIGAILIALVYMGGYISGAHYNPAVTVAILLTKKISTQTASYYIITQFLAAITASAVYSIITYQAFVPQIGANVNLITAIIIEAIFTFLLCIVVLNTAVSDKTKGNDYYGLAIGFTVMAGAIVAGPISGAAFNPAVGIGPLLFDFGNLFLRIPSLILYFLGPLLGGILASWVYKIK